MNKGLMLVPHQKLTEVNPNDQIFDKADTDDDPHYIGRHFCYFFSALYAPGFSCQNDTD
jgi:hypothetical protein